MAGVAIGEQGLAGLVLERKHQPGRKLLMCGNNRCNVSNAVSAEALLDAYGAPVAAFLRPAVQAFPPGALRDWFRAQGLDTVVHKDGKVYPHTERADDVLHCFTDGFRLRQVPLVANAPVSEVERLPDGAGFAVRSVRFEIRARHVLIATGGVSYPKTGSVGDGQRLAKELGHSIQPYRPGLAGMDAAALVPLTQACEPAFPACRVRVEAESGLLGVIDGEVTVTRRGLRGPAVVDASRLVSRAGVSGFRLVIDLLPDRTEADLVAELGRRDRGRGIADTLSGWLVPSAAAPVFARLVLGCSPAQGLSDLGDRRVAAVLKAWTVVPDRVRPLKEAMVTVGGVSLGEVDPATMESRVCPGLFFAGEVLDVDGPTGGYNLHAAFATARLAIGTMARRDPHRVSLREPGGGGGERRRGRPKNDRRSRSRTR
jgi:predicted Rossmann fold flavoprotein